MSDRINSNTRNMNDNRNSNSSESILSQLPVVVTPEGTTLMNIPPSHFKTDLDSIVQSNGTNGTISNSIVNSSSSSNQSNNNYNNNNNSSNQSNRMFSIDTPGLNVSTPDLLSAYTDHLNDSNLEDQHALVSYADDNNNTNNSNRYSDEDTNNKLAKWEDDTKRLIAANISTTVPHKRPAFVSKLWTMINDRENNKYIDWSEDGKSIHVFNREEFMKKVLPKFFKHNNFSSFVRQLNMYGWHKVQDIDSGSLLSTEECLEFENPFFIRGREDLLDSIVRNKSGGNTTTHGSNSANGSNANGSNAANNGTKDASGMSEKDIQNVLSELEFLKKKQRVITEDLRRVRLDNEILWKENFIARERHKTQSQTLDKILRFLATIYGNNATRLLEDQQFQLYGLNGGNANGGSNSNNGYQPNDTTNSMVQYPYSHQAQSQGGYSNQQQGQPISQSNQQAGSYDISGHYSQQQQQQQQQPQQPMQQHHQQQPPQQQQSSMPPLQPAQKPLLMIAHSSYNPALSPTSHDDTTVDRPVSDQIQEIQRESPKIDEITNQQSNNITEITTPDITIPSPVTYYTNLSSSGLTPQFGPIDSNNLTSSSSSLPNDITPIEMLDANGGNRTGPYQSNQIETVTPSDGGGQRSHRPSTNSVDVAAVRPGLERNNSSVIMSDIEKNLFKQQTQLEQINDYLHKFHNYKDPNEEFSIPAAPTTATSTLNGPADLIDDDFKVDDFFVSQTPTEMFTPVNGNDLVGDNTKDDRIAEILEESPTSNSNPSTNGNPTPKSVNLSPETSTTPIQRKRASVTDFTDDILSLPVNKKPRN